MFNCSTDHSAVTITWILNKTVPASTLASYGVTTSGIGTPVSSLTIPGLVNPFNNTEVLCFASGPGFGDVSPPPVILRIQGRLEPTVYRENFTSLSFREIKTRMIHMCNIKGVAWR